MPDIIIQASSQCETTTGGKITGSWSAVRLQDATVTAYGTSTSGVFSETYENSAGGSFAFDSLPNDLYEVSVTGTEDGASNIVELNVSCSVTPPPSGCDLELSKIKVTPKTGLNNNGTAIITVFGSGAIQYSLDNVEWQTSNEFTGLDAGAYTAYIRKSSQHSCAIQQGFVISFVQDFTLLTGPNRDWLPVELPITYTFQNPGAFDTINVRVEASDNGVDFNNPAIAGVLNVLPDSFNQYTVNPAPYLAALFAPGVPVFGIDNRLFRLYRLAVGRTSQFDGTGEPELYTVPARCLYASALTFPEINGDLILSHPPTAAFNQDYAGIFTKVDAVLQAVTNTATDIEPGAMAPCPKYPLHLYWLNRFGGWQSWVFDAKHEYEDEVGEGETWQDEYGHTHAASVGPVVSRVNVFSGHVSKAAFETIHTIRHSIKVYHRDGNNWREVILDRGSFPKYKAGDKRREVNFSFAYSEPILMQHA